MQLSEKRKKVFFEFFVPFMESTSNFKHFEKTMMVLANVFRKLQAVKTSSHHSVRTVALEHA